MLKIIFLALSGKHEGIRELVLKLPDVEDEGYQKSPFVC
jgi:hypothetical protein